LTPFHLTSTNEGRYRILPGNIGKRFGVATFIVFLMLLASFPTLTVDAFDIQSDLNTGPYVERVVFKEFLNRDQRMLALFSGEIEFQNEWILPQLLTTLIEDPDISVTTGLRNGYGHITINCDKYPLNISGLRRAFAYAFDKTYVRAEIFEGLAQEHDSVVPFVNDWCIEDQLPHHYYLAQPEVGNQILDELNFSIDSVSGFRKAPDGSFFKVIIEYGSTSELVGGNTARAGVDALLSLNINAESRFVPIHDLLSRIVNHEDYDMAFYATNYYSKHIDWLAYQFGSEYKDVAYLNPCNFENDSFDSWCNQLLYSTEKADVDEAAAAMQLILHENVPKLVVYQNIYTQAYRNDVFSGHIMMMGGYIDNPWTLRKIHRIDGIPDGTVNIGYEGVTSFNIFIQGRNVNALLWPSLYSFDPNLDPWPYLVDNLLMETHTDNPAVPMGHTRFNIDIIENATWSDGTPLTASDVAFTYTYLYESGLHGNPAALGLEDLVAAYAPTTNRVVVEFNTESYWHFANLAYFPIIPEHIFNDIDGIGYENWNTWNPVINPSHPHVTLGPFIVTDFVAGDFLELSANPDFCYYPQIFTTPTTTSTSESPTTPGYADNLAIVVGAVGASAVILTGGYFLLRPEES
jgi:peptide/nickel transport system substrate-binding protein